MENGRPVVADDPLHVLRDLLEFARDWARLRGRRREEAWAEWFAPDGPGITVPDTFAATRLTDPEDVPPEWAGLFDPDVAEIWGLWTFHVGRAPDAAVLPGPELRHLLARAAELWRDLPDP